MTHGTVRGQIHPSSIDLPPTRVGKNLSQSRIWRQSLNGFAQMIFRREASVDDGIQSPTFGYPVHATETVRSHPRRRQLPPAREHPADDEGAGTRDAVINDDLLLHICREIAERLHNRAVVF